jgi:drug/metabolite transporter (DMT)-like permease
MAAACAASAMYNVAIALQALEAREVPPEHGLRPSLLLRLLRRRRWLAGAALNLLGWPLQTVALLWAPLTVVQPCLAAGLLLLLAIGTRVLHEHVGRREIISILMIIFGVVGLGFAAPHRTTNEASAVTVAIVLGVIGLLALLPYVLSVARRSTGLPVAISAGLAFAWSGISTKLLADGLATGDWTPIVAWAAATGVAAGIGTASEMTALQSRGATEVAPLVFVIQLLVPALLAPLLVNEPWGATPLGGAVLAVSLLVVAAGSALLASSRVVTALTAGPSGDLSVEGGAGIPRQGPADKASSPSLDGADPGSSVGKTRH